MMHPRPKMFLAPAMFRMDGCEVSRSGIGGGETVVERDLGLGSEHERANTPSTGKADSIKQGRRALARPLIWTIKSCFATVYRAVSGGAGGVQRGTGRRAGFVQAPSWRQRRFKARLRARLGRIPAGPGGMASDAARLPDPREGGPGRHGGRRRRDFPGPGRSERGVGDDGCLVDSKTSDASQPATIKRPKTSWPHYASPRSYAIGVE